MSRASFAEALGSKALTTAVFVAGNQGARRSLPDGILCDEQTLLSSFSCPFFFFFGKAQEKTREEDVP